MIDSSYLKYDSVVANEKSSCVCVMSLVQPHAGPKFYGRQTFERERDRERGAGKQKETERDRS